MKWMLVVTFRKVNTKMPAMPREMKSKATKIAFKILGKPPIFRKEPKKKIDERILFENTQRVR
jgi:hypothetical protein